MYCNRSILAIVPARGGSKGIPLKNIRPLGGVPLIEYTGKVINQTNIIDRAVVSTDHSGIAQIAKECGLDVPFYRPVSLSGDMVGDLEVLIHALTEMERIDGKAYDIILMLQPTSPFRTAEHIENSVKKLIETEADSVWTLSQTDSKGHPDKQLIIKEGKIEFYSERGAEIIARQQLNPTFHKNGITYAITRNCLLNKKSIKGDKCVPLIIEGYIPNIDSEIDIKFAEFLIQNKE